MGTIQPVVSSEDNVRPRLTLRVGIVGHRALFEESLQAIAARVEHVLEDIGRTVAHLAKEKLTRELYADAPPIVQLVSPLAEGVDRIAARAVYGLAHPSSKVMWQLVAPLPFPQLIYEGDFASSVDEFRELLMFAKKTGGVVELDGSIGGHIRGRRCPTRRSGGSG